MKEQPTAEEENLRENHFYVGYLATGFYLTMLVLLIIAKFRPDQLLVSAEYAHGFSLAGAFFSTLVFFHVHKQQKYDCGALICPSVAMACLFVSILLLFVPLSYEMRDEVLWIIPSFSVNLLIQDYYFASVCVRMCASAALPEPLPEPPESTKSIKSIKSTDPLKEPFIV